ncbi:putative rubber elongation factor [Helianthus anomalus]
MKTAYGLVKTAYIKLEPTAKGLLTNYEPVAEQYAVSAWQSSFHSSLSWLRWWCQRQLIIPSSTTKPTTYFFEKYNQIMQQTSKKGFKISLYLLLVPTKKISKVFNTVEPQAEPIVSSKG